MTHNELVRQDSLLRAEVDGLLERHDVFGILRPFGRVHLSGSYAMRLMTWRDLDIYLEMPEVNVVSFMEVGRCLVKALTPRKASYTDHIHFPATEGVPGLYWGIQTGMPAENSWKLDVWGLDSHLCAQRRRHTENILLNLDDQRRASILAIKNAVCHDPRYRNSITSQHVYDAVLKHHITTIDGFWTHVGNMLQHNG